MNTVKKIKADVNNPIFKKIGTGLYEAKLFGYLVHFDRVAATIWEARVVGGEDDGRLLAVSEKRQKAVQEAFQNLYRAEQKRLQWVLENDELRSYNGSRGQYKTDIKIDENTSQKDREEKRKEEAREYINSIVRGNAQPELKLVEKVEKVKPAVENVGEDDDEDDSAKIPKNLMNTLTTEQRLRLAKLYKIRKNHMTGKFAVIGYNSDGGFNKILDENFATAGDAYTYMLKCEGILKD